MAVKQPTGPAPMTATHLFGFLSIVDASKSWGLGRMREGEAGWGEYKYFAKYEREREGD